MIFTVLIPARLASTRLPDKPLADICGVPMVVRVAQQALKSGASRVVVAADSQRIVDSCHAFAVEAVLTRQDHLSGSDRLAEACNMLKLADKEIVVNVQGDEPLIAPELIDAVASLLAQRTDCEMATAAHPIGSMKDFVNPNLVKVVLDAKNTALYFSRSSIPAARDFGGEAWWSQGSFPPPLRHIGIYAYRSSFVRKFPDLSPAPIEKLESLEQLRALWHGYRIAVHVSEDEPAMGVDTPEDLERARALFGR